MRKLRPTFFAADPQLFVLQFSALLSESAATVSAELSSESTLLSEQCFNLFTPKALSLCTDQADAPSHSLSTFCKSAKIRSSLDGSICLLSAVLSTGNAINWFTFTAHIQSYSDSLSFQWKHKAVCSPNPSAALSLAVSWNWTGASDSYQSPAMPKGRATAILAAPPSPQQCLSLTEQLRHSPGRTLYSQTPQESFSSTLFITLFLWVMSWLIFHLTSKKICKKKASHKFFKMFPFIFHAKCICSLIICIGIWIRYIYVNDINFYLYLIIPSLLSRLFSLHICRLVRSPSIAQWKVSSVTTKVLFIAYTQIRFVTKEINIFDKRDTYNLWAKKNLFDERDRTCEQRNKIDHKRNECDCTNLTQRYLKCYFLQLTVQARHTNGCIVDTDLKINKNWVCVY